MTIGQKIVQLRLAKGISQEQLAETLNISRQSVSKWEMDQALPQIDKVLQLSELFCISTDELLRDKVIFTLDIGSMIAGAKYRGEFEERFKTVLNEVKSNPSIILFIDEIHRLNRAVEEILYPAMEDFAFDIIMGKGPAARSLRLDLPKFTLVGATTRAGLLTAPLRDRFGVISRLEMYNPEELGRIVKRSANILQAEIDEKGAREIALRSRGTPRIANRLLKRVRDFAQVKGDGRITGDIAKIALDALEVDKLGLDNIDRTLLTTIIVKFAGGPVGLDTLAAATGEEHTTIEDVYEPYLIQLGFISKTPRGRIAMPLAYNHLGLSHLINNCGNNSSDIKSEERPTLFDNIE